MSSALPASVKAHPRLSQWIRLHAGRMTVFTGKVELGQGVLSAIRQIAADAVRVPPERIDVVSGDTRRVPDEWYTAGSVSVETAWAVLRPVGLHLRCLLLDAAARRLGVPVDTLSLVEGRVQQAGRDTGLEAWDLAGAVEWDAPLAALRAPDAEPASSAMGMPVRRHDLAARVAGAGFLHDLAPPDLLHARVVRGATVHDEVVRERRFPAVRVLRWGGFTAVVADREEQAVAAAASRQLFPREDPPEDEPCVQPADLLDRPAVERVVAAGSWTPGVLEVEATYERGTLAHASIGPCCALAYLDPGEGLLLLWTHSQGVFALRSEVARALAGCPQVRQVEAQHVPGAGCYGHNGADDVAMEAALVAVLCPGRTVRLLWSRPEEFQQAPVGPPVVVRLRAGLVEGRIAAWQARLWSAPHGCRPGWGGRINLPAAVAALGIEESPVEGDVPPEAGGGGDRNAVPMYALPQMHITYRCVSDWPVRTSSLRTLGAHANVFAIEGFMDELAALADCDPLAFRLRHLDDRRARHVLERAAAMAGWSPGQVEGEGRGKGLAVARYKNKAAWMAAVVDVELEADIRVRNVWCAVDCGRVVDPDGVANQVEGGVVQALSWSLREELRVTRGGRIVPGTWEEYPILGFADAPRIHVELVAGEGPPLGVGEVAAGPVAGALGNAIAVACGVRLRQLPITRERLERALT